MKNLLKLSLKQKYFDSLVLFIICFIKTFRREVRGLCSFAFRVHSTVETKATLRVSAAKQQLG